MLASATATIVLSRKVRNSTVHSAASATGRPRQPTSDMLEGTASASAIGLSPARRRDHMALLSVSHAKQTAERCHGNLPMSADVHGGTLKILLQWPAAEQDREDHVSLPRRMERHPADRRRRLKDQAADSGLGL